MQDDDFKAFLGSLEALTPTQVLEAIEGLHEVRQRTEAVSQIEQRARTLGTCPYCGSATSFKWGRTRTGVQRYCCQSCLKTFTRRTGTNIARLHRPGLFLDLVRDMLDDGRPLSVRQLARRLRLNKYTAWRWRMIALRTFAGASDKTFSGIVEADETFQKESRKGSREWVRHLRDPANHPEPPRLRWYEYGKRGIPMLRGLSRWQLPILTVADRAGARCFERIPDQGYRTIHQVLSSLLPPDAILCTDGHPAYKTFTQSREMEHFVIRTKPGQKTQSRSHHIRDTSTPCTLASRAS